MATNRTSTTRAREGRLLGRLLAVLSALAGRGRRRRVSGLTTEQRHRGWPGGRASGAAGRV